MYCLCDREEIVKETIEHATKLVQAVADALFSLPSTEDPDGPLVKLPEPTTKLPREKPVSYLFFRQFDEHVNLKEGGKWEKWFLLIEPAIYCHLLDEGQG